jgi:glyoxylate/hydroxypyruvate reductase A
MSLLLVSDYEDTQEWQRRLSDLAPDVELRFWPDLGTPEEILMVATDDVLPNGVLPSLRNLKCIQYLGHGAADVLDDPELPAGVAVTRLNDPGIIQWMTEWALTYVLHHRRHVAVYEREQREVKWEFHPVPLAQETRVAILGLGSIGTRVAKILARLDFEVTGWARGPHTIEGVACHHGPESLRPLLEESDYVVCVLPGTAATHALFDAELFGAMKAGAYLLNMGRGSLIDTEAMIRALDSGQLAGVALDVFDPEPLPADSPLWRHPKITITPHVAGGFASTGIEATIENYRRLSRGEQLANLADAECGY